MKFDPFDPVEIKSPFLPLPDGEYDFVITKVEIANSANGNVVNMILSLTVSSTVGERNCKVWIGLSTVVEENKHFLKFTLKKFLECIGKIDLCQKGVIEEKEIVNMRGRALFTESEYTKKDGTQGSAIKVVEWKAKDVNAIIDDQLPF